MDSLGRQFSEVNNYQKLLVNYTVTVFLQIESIFK